MIRQAVVVVLFCAAVASALSIVLQRHDARKTFSALQELQTEKNELDREWGQLLLEQGTWGTHGRIEAIARDKLNMTLPAVKEIYRVRS